MDLFVMDFMTAAVNTGSKVSLGDSLLIALIGIVLVFGVLILLMAAIWLMGYLMNNAPQFSAKHPKLAANVLKIKGAFRKKAPAVVSEQTAVEEKPELASGSCGELKLINTTERDAAMIMAIVADATNTPLNELRFKSIKYVEEGENK